MTNLIVANFKMHGTNAFIENWFADFTKNSDISKNVIIALPATHIAAFRDYGLVLSGQNVSASESGAFTSQISAKMLKDSGADYCIIGHSEAREQLSESNKSIKEKYEQLKNIQMSPIVCVGESLQIKESGKTKEHLKSQLSLFNTETEDLIIAYEPIWAIGTGLVPTEKEIDDLILKRQIAKENRDYTNADQIREQLLKLDIILEDKPDKTIWRKS